MKRTVIIIVVIGIFIGVKVKVRAGIRMRVVMNSGWNYRRLGRFSFSLWRKVEHRRRRAVAAVHGGGGVDVKKTM
ncbi:hypothetical protein Hanom_Chr15g01367091 [Helianthus anomalus]